jgi:malonate-semialdehyde dehydrogenase (acetylating)/methylmalonate-semialdehyde dehydrogenase
MSATTATREVMGNFVAGRWIVDDDSERMPIHNPATGEAIGSLVLSSRRDVGDAVAAAQAAFPAWREVPPHERARCFFALRDLLVTHREELAALITLDMGKTLDDARGEVQRGIENIETACGIPSLMMGYGLEDGAAAGIDEEVIYQPLGVFAGIAPFNFPFMIAFWFWPYAVACGNTFVLKPSEQDPLVQRLVFELVSQAGFPPGVVNLVNGGPDVADALIDHPDVRGISFVGSTAVARHVYARASAAGKRVQAQGGAKNALVVMPDAELDTAVPNILGSSFGAAGQRCLAGSLLMAVAEAHGEVVGVLREAAAAMRVGDGSTPGVDVGPVVSATARDRIRAAISNGVDEGADLLVDGRSAHVDDRPHGFFVGPTLFDGVEPSMRLAREEVFGPVLGVTPVPTLADAIAAINANPYGNAASIFTRDGGAAREFRYRVETGNVGINVGVAAPIAAFPFSGAKQSFFGTLHGQGRDAVRFFTESKVVITRWPRPAATGGR